MKKRIFTFLLSVMLLIGVLNYNVPNVNAASGYSIRINYQTNTVNIYYNGEPYKCFLCSTGTWTPHSGTYNLGTKYRWSMLKGGVWGQYCTVITGNIWFHSVPYFSKNPGDLEYEEYDKLGTACSAGCVRMAVRDVKWVYDNIPAGTPVTFYASSDPGPFGKPSSIKICNTLDYYKHWDPTDTDPSNPWNTNSQYMQSAFNTTDYLKYNPSVKSNIGNDVPALKAHWISTGIPSGYRGSNEFDVNIYKKNYPDLVTVFGNNNYAYVSHYNTSGKSEGRIADMSVEELQYIFNAEYYAAKYPELKAVYGTDGYKLLNHFIRTGINEGKEASPIFNINYYKSHYSDLKKAFGNDNLAYAYHFVKKGINEGRKASPYFDIKIYKSNYEDLRKAFGNNNLLYVTHFINRGLNEGRDANAIFNVKFYKNEYADLKNAYGNNGMDYLLHFQRRGVNEGRQASAQFSVKIYKSNYTDLQNAFGSNNSAYVEHYASNGLNEGRLANISLKDLTYVFNYKYYADKYPDLKNVLGYNESLLRNHFLTHGIKEGRQAHPNFSVKAYKARYSDLQKAYGDDNMKYVQHYMKYGVKEGRKGN